MPSQPTINIVLIHNNYEDRLERIRPHLRELSEAVDGQYFEISEQPSLRPLSRLETFRRIATLRVLEQLQDKYVERPTKSWLPIWGSLSKLAFKILVRRKPYTEERNRTAIESYLTNKHINAWCRYGKNAHFLVVFEDDSMFLERSSSDFQRLVGELRNTVTQDCIYIDLAGGHSLDVLEHRAINVRHIRRL